ncbi:uncharacterized protein LOC116775763 isoform X2 [Danaus plexippus]|nr:uncharacterized protein LOC116775763 isoform X2 [Danaus plexippus]
MIRIILITLVTRVLATPVMTRQDLLKEAQRAQFCENLININNLYYSFDETKKVTGIPADMSVHWKTGNVFYTLINDNMKMSLQVLHPSGDAETIKVAGLGQSTTVDNLNDVVYLATDNGVYKYKEDGSIELYAALGEDVMYVTVSNDGSVMYIATWPQNRVHKITNEGQKQEMFPAIPNGHGITVDTRNNIFFVATQTSHVLKNGHNIPIKIKGLPSERITGVFVSRSDEIYAMDENSNLYSIDAENANARHLGTFNISGVNTFAMDSADNVLIGVRGGIQKFNAYEQDPCRNYDKFSGSFKPKHASHLMPLATTTRKRRHNKVGKRHSRRRKHRRLTTTTTVASELFLGIDDEEE